MNLAPPPPSCESYHKRLYDFLTSPVFDSLRLIPRSQPENDSEGQLYYDTDNGLQFGAGGGSYSSTAGQAFVRREADAEWDFTNLMTPSYFNTSLWQDMDLSSIVTDSNASAVLINFYASDTSAFEATDYVYFRAKGDDEDESHVVTIKKPHMYRVAANIIVPLPSDGSLTIQSRMGTSTSFDNVYCGIMGWFV